MEATSGRRLPHGGVRLPDTHYCHGLLGICSRRRAHAAVQARSASARGAESSEYGSGFRAWKRDLIVFPNWHGAAVLLPRTPRTEADASRKSKKPIFPSPSNNPVEEH